MLHSDTIDILDKKMPITIIDDWKVAIRECELKHLAHIFGQSDKLSINRKAYNILMDVLTKNNLTLLDLVLFNDEYFFNLKKSIAEKSENFSIFNILEKCRSIVNGNLPGSNIIRYTLYTLNNRIIKLQESNIKCTKLSNLFLDSKCIPFDKMPLIMSLKGHNPSIYDLKIV